MKFFRRYVKTYLLENDVRSNKKKTKAKKQTLNPVFDEIITVSARISPLLQNVYRIVSYSTFKY